MLTVGRSQRKGQIDALRAIAIFWVIFDHLWLTEGVGPLGRMGVRLFFVISGFLITGIVLRSRRAVETGQASWQGELRSFYIRRALRIFPAYYLLIILTFVIYHSHFRGSLLWHLSFQSSILFAIGNEWGPPWQLVHLWTLSIQEQFYLFWPLLIIFVPSKLMVPSVIFMFLVEPVFRFIATSIGADDAVGASTLLPGQTAALATGSLAAVWRQDSKQSGLRDVLAMGALATAAALLLEPLGVVSWSKWVHAWIVDLVWLYPLVTLLLATSEGIAGIVGKVLDAPLLQSAGRISLGIYLYHLLAVALIWSVSGRLGLGPLHRGPGLFAAGISLAIVAAMISWVAFERPIGRLKRYFPYQASSGTQSGL